MSARKYFGLNIDVFSRNGNRTATHGEWEFDTEAQAKGGVGQALYKISPQLRPGQRYVIRIVQHEAVFVSAPQMVE